MIPPAYRRGRSSNRRSETAGGRNQVHEHANTIRREFFTGSWKLNHSENPRVSQYIMVIDFHSSISDPARRWNVNHMANCFTYCKNSFFCCCVFVEGPCNSKICVRTEKWNAAITGCPVESNLLAKQEFISLFTSRQQTKEQIADSQDRRTKRYLNEKWGAQ